jgi:hypothetical protein
MLALAACSAPPNVVVVREERVPVRDVTLEVDDDVLDVFDPPSLPTVYWEAPPRRARSLGPAEMAKMGKAARRASGRA